jgi:hypothetical protein
MAAGKQPPKEFDFTQAPHILRALRIGKGGKCKPPARMAPKKGEERKAWPGIDADLQLIPAKGESMFIYTVGATVLCSVSPVLPGSIGKLNRDFIRRKRSGTLKGLLDLIFRLA